MPTLIVSELRVGINVVFFVIVISSVEIEDVGSGNDNGEPTTQLGRKAPSDTDAGTAEEETFISEETCGLGLLKLVVMGAPGEAVEIEEKSGGPEVLRGSSALLFCSVVTAGGRKELVDVPIGLSDTVSDDVRPTPEVSSVDDTETVVKMVGLLDRIVELLVLKSTGEVNVELVVSDSMGAALVADASVTLNVVPGIVADCESVLIVWPSWLSLPSSPDVGVDVLAVAEVNGVHISVHIPGPSRPASFNGMIGGSLQGRFSAGEFEDPASLSRPARARVRSDTASLDSLKTSMPTAASQLHCHGESSCL